MRVWGLLKEVVGIISIKATCEGIVSPSKGGLKEWERDTWHILIKGKFWRRKNCKKRLMGDSLQRKTK